MAATAPPPVTIGMPVRDGERSVEAAVRSLLAQTFGDFHLLICDNGSTDGTEEICRALAAADARITYDRSEVDLGAFPNFNRVLHRGTGEFFQWAAHDDLWEPTFLERCVQVLRDAPDAAGAAPRFRRTDETGKVVTGEGAPPARFAAMDRAERVRGLLDADNLNVVYGLLRRRAALTTGGFREVRGSEYRLVLRLLLAGRVVGVPEILFTYREHARDVGELGADLFGPASTLAGDAGVSMPATLAGILADLAAAPLPPQERAACVAAATATALNRTSMFNRLAMIQLTGRVKRHLAAHRPLRAAGALAQCGVFGPRTTLELVAGRLREPRTDPR